MSALSGFSNTEIAFRRFSDSELRASSLLFRMIGLSWLVKIGKPILVLALSLRLPVKGLIRATVFRQFCGGESIGSSKESMKRLMAGNVFTILDYSGEGKETENDFAFTFNQVMETIHEAASDKRIAFCVFKPSGIGTHFIMETASNKGPFNDKEKSEFDLFRSRFQMLCRASSKAGIPIFVDAEESWIQPVIDELTLEMMRELNQEKAMVFNTLQMYRKDRLEYLHQLGQIASRDKFFVGLKLVRGAYLEKERKRAEAMGYPSPVHDTKEATDRDFDKSLKFCLSHINRFSVCAGTHNEKSALLLMEGMESAGLKNNDQRIWFSQLLGMSDHISFNLAASGYNVAKYVPFGKIETVMPYLFRRAEENTAIAGQMGRELTLIRQEQKRRAALKRA